METLSFQILSWWDYKYFYLGIEESDETEIEVTPKKQTIGVRRKRSRKMWKADLNHQKLEGIKMKSYMSNSLDSIDEVWTLEEAWTYDFINIEPSLQYINIGSHMLLDEHLSTERYYLRMKTFKGFITSRRRKNSI